MIVIFSIVAFSGMIVGESLSTRSLGMGGSGVSFKRGLDSLFVNPAGIMMQRVKSIDVSYSYNNRYMIENYHVHAFGVLAPRILLESYPFDEYPLDFGLTFVNESITGLLNQNDFGLSAGLVKIKMFSAGFEFHYKDISFGDKNFASLSSFYYKIGVIYTVKNLGFGAVYNSLDADLQTVFENLMMGFSYEQNSSRLTMSADVGLKRSPLYADGFVPIINGGIEKEITQNILLRAGIRNLKFTVGLGVLVEKFGFDYAFDATVGGNHQITLKYGI